MYISSVICHAMIAGLGRWGLGGQAARSRTSTSRSQPGQVPLLPTAPRARLKDPDTYTVTVYRRPMPPMPIPIPMPMPTPIPSSCRRMSGARLLELFPPGALVASLNR